VKSSKLIVVMFSMVLFGISCLLVFGVSIFLKRIGTFFILSVLNIFWIFSADSGMKGERSFEVSLIASTN